MDVDLSLDYGLTLLAALLIGTGFVLQQNAAEREPASRFLRLGLLTDLLRKPRWLTGIASMVGGQILAAWSIGHLELSVVEPLLTTNLIWALVLAVPISRRTRPRRTPGSGSAPHGPPRQAAADESHPPEPVSQGPAPHGPAPAAPAPGRKVAVPRRSVRAWEVAGAAVLCTGVGLLSSARSAKPIGMSFGSFSHWPAAAVIAAMAFIAVHAGRRRPGRRRALLTGAGAGLVYGIQDALTRQALEILQSSGAGALLTTWAPYALVGAGAIGIWLMQSAFSAGPLQVSLPAIAAGEPVVGILLGIVVFGDRIQIAPGPLAIEACGLAALVAGVILVSRAPVLSQLRGWPPPGITHPPIGLPNLPNLPGLPGHPGLPHGASRHCRDEGHRPAAAAAQDAPHEKPPADAESGPHGLLAVLRGYRTCHG